MLGELDSACDSGVLAKKSPKKGKLQDEQCTETSNRRQEENQATVDGKDSDDPNADGDVRQGEFNFETSRP